MHEYIFFSPINIEVSLKLKENQFFVVIIFYPNKSVKQNIQTVMKWKSRTPLSSDIKYKNPNIGFIGSLKKGPSPDHCLQMLYSLSHRVSKLMQDLNLKVGVLQEFFPKDDNLLGLNVNHGQKILLRLRKNADPYMLLDEDMVLDTLLHELCHNRIGPHNDAFHKLWDEYRSKQYGNQALGLYNNFLGKGKKLVDGPIKALVDNNLIAKKSLQKAKMGKGRKLGRVSTKKTNDECLLSPAEMARQAALDRMKKFEEESCSCNKDLDIDHDSDIEIVDMNDNGKIDNFIDLVEDSDIDQKSIERPPTKKLKQKGKLSINRPKDEDIEIIILSD